MNTNYYRVTYEIDIEAETPLQAARIADDYMQRVTRSYEPFFKLRDLFTGETFRIDLEEYKQ